MFHFETVYRHRMISQLNVKMNKKSLATKTLKYSLSTAVHLRV